MKMGTSSKSPASSPRAARTQRKDAVTSENLVRYEFDPANPPPLTEAQKAELAALAAMSDDDIDYSDIAPTPDDFWTNAVRGKFYRPTKTSTTVRIDSDVLAWLRAQGKGYQSRLNAILRREMLATLKR
jgi:uncharacterized protein (DUF4415 family)